MSKINSLVPPENTRDFLVQKIEGSAEWRQSKAAEYFEDGRNAQCAAALERAAREVAALPDSDSRLVTLERLLETQDEDGLRRSASSPGMASTGRKRARTTCWTRSPGLSAVKQSCRSAYDETCRLRAGAYGFSSGGRHLLLAALACGP